MFHRALFMGYSLAIMVMAQNVILPSSQAAIALTSPKKQFGFNPGDDYQLANYQQLTTYWQRLAAESSRMKLIPIGPTEEGRTQWMAVISSVSNLRRLETHRTTARRLALAEGLTDAEARTLANKGRAIVLVSGGLHATETLGSQQLLETVYRLVSQNDAETLRILENVIVLFVPANPDGMDLVVNWYMREPTPEKRSLSTVPRLYQKYTGHDNNRDFYAVTQLETKNLCRVMFREWFPQIIYDHHQSGPPGTVMFAPPFRDPFNYHLDPRVMNGVEAVGAAMVGRFLAEGKPGVTVRSGARYSAWYNGGLRAIGYYHNAICLLTETIGSPNPSSVPYTPSTLLPRNDLLAPIPPQPWHMKQSIEYAVTANLAVFDYAARNRAELLWSRYAIGRDAIAAGHRDTWTPSPSRITQAQDALKTTTNTISPGSITASASAQATAKKKKTTTSPAVATNDFAKYFQAPADRNPRGYILPADQPDFGTATKFINTLIENGVRVWRATNAFAAAGHSYPEGSYAVPCNQAFRAHVLDSFEPQEHPNDLQYPGGPPIAPYDLAGWTLAMQMAVRFDRVFENLSGPFKQCDEVQKLAPGKVTNKPELSGFFIRAEANEAFHAVNRLLAAGETVQRLIASVQTSGGDYPAGTFYVAATQPSTRARVDTLARELGVNFSGATVSANNLKPLRSVRVGLWDSYGGSMSSGWTRWLLEKFEFPFEVVYAPRLNQGNLRSQFDVLIFVTGAMPTNASSNRAITNSVKPDTTNGDAISSNSETNAKDESLPPEYRGRRGNLSVTNTIPRLREFMQNGGTVLTIGSSTKLAELLGLPVTSHLVEKPNKESDKPKSLPREKFYIPGSLVRARVDTAHPLAWGMDSQADFMFQSSPVFRLKKDKHENVENNSTPLRKVAWFDEKAPLRSGWAIGQEHLQDGMAVMEATVGNGRLVLYGPEITFRAQPHGTFKLLFNGIFNAGMGEQPINHNATVAKPGGQ